MNNDILKAKVSKLFYQGGLSKIEIGKKLRISRFKVAQLLEDALKDGMVKIIINEPQNTFLDLESSLEEKFKIYRAAVVETSFSYEETKKNIGRAAANCLLDMVYDGDVIGVAWGTTIYEMVNFLPLSIERNNISVVQITGGLNQVSMDFNAIELTRRVAKAFGAKSYQLYAPAVVDSIETKNVLMSESNIKKTIEMFSKINIAIVGVGSVVPEPSTMLYRDGFIRKEDFENISKCGAVGDINSYFYDKNGNRCKTELERRTIGIDLDHLRRVRYVMAVCGGKSKADAIYGALKGKIINIVVTDEETAKEILKK
ncbi:Deoxyribonucleoside regulator [subsurface metagenome]